MNMLNILTEANPKLKNWGAESLFLFKSYYVICVLYFKSLTFHY